MSARARGCSLRTATAALLALAAAVSIAPVRTHAACSQHVVARTAPVAGLSLLERLALDATAAQAGAPHAPAPDRRPPCDGPFCSRGGSVPLPTPAVPVVDRLEASEMLADGLLMLGLGISHMTSIEASSRALHRGQSIDRPPRATAVAPR
jgi:hypothetical protein